MQYLNRNMKNRQEVGHIDLLERFCYIEVPEKDATKVMRAIAGTTYKGLDVRCNDAADTGKPATRRTSRGGKPEVRTTEKSSRRSKRSDETADFSKFEKKSKRSNGKFNSPENSLHDNGNKNDWRQFFRNDDIKLVGDEPDFSEEGWARRRPKKK